LMAANALKLKASAAKSVMSKVFMKALLKSVAD
jgi:hypothetical protein